MAIEKMSLVTIEGNIKKVNKTLVKCCESGCFHVINSSHSNDASKNNGFKTLKDNNHFAPLINRGSAIANSLGITLKKVDYEDVKESVSIDFVNYFEEIEKRTNELSEKKSALEESLHNHSTALIKAEQLAGFSVDFAELYACKYVKLRFGRLPIESVPKLDYYKDRCFLFYPFQSEENYLWALYLVPDTYAVEIDDIMSSIYFERIRMPDYFKGDADEVKTTVLKLVKEESEELDKINDQLRALGSEIEEQFIKVYSKLLALNESYDLRSSVAVVNRKFFVSGFVPKRQFAKFKSLLNEIDDIEVIEKPADSEADVSPPVLLRNNAIVRPFEMFVKMYGLPSYDGFDPTPYVAFTFMLMYGIMFGDLGQGIVISLLGIILNAWRKVKLAPIMTRIGVTSAIFGVLYGSVFGNEEIIEPFFKFGPVYRLIGLQSAPHDIFQVSTLLLISALGIGVILILISMVFNIVMSIQKHDVEKAVLSPNGIVGFVLYASLIAGAALQLGLGIEMFTPLYVICLIVLPLAILFFKEPIGEFFEKHRSGNVAEKNSALVHAIKTYSDAMANVGSVRGKTVGFEELAQCRYLKVQFGEMPFDSYLKLENYNEMSYCFFPFENDENKISGVYITPTTDAPAIDRTFSKLGFVKMKMPEHISDIRKQKNLHLELENGEKKEKKTVGTFIIEGIIELFESMLTYITNTMSFLRIGGFILSHAGMMLVVNVLAEQAGAGVGFIIVQILGNLFVIGMEGFLVGIQVLRLEFYEIFSRFYEGKGKPFNPVTINLTKND